MSSEAAGFLENYRVRANARLAARMARRRAELKDLPLGIATYFDLLTEYVLRGGKRLRGALVVAGYEAFGGTEGDAILEASLSFELLHAALLAYDDVMDRDELRRGGKALHVAAIDEATSRGSDDPKLRGESVNMLLGLLAISEAGACLTDAGFAPDRMGRARAHFDDVLKVVTLGQLLDVASLDAKTLGARDIAEIHVRKTGSYTTQGPLLLGALLAGRSLTDPDVVALDAWAAQLGTAFQLVDDALGLDGDPAVTGKPVGNDLANGRAALLLEHALDELKGPEAHAQGQRLRAFVGRRLTPAEVDEARTILLGAKIPDVLRDTARAHVADRSALDRLPPASARLLDGLATLLVERDA